MQITLLTQSLTIPSFEDAPLKLDFSKQNNILTHSFWKVFAWFSYFFPWVMGGGETGSKFICFITLPH